MARRADWHPGAMLPKTLIYRARGRRRKRGAAVSSEVIRLAVAYNDALDSARRDVGAGSQCTPPAEVL